MIYSGLKTILHHVRVLLSLLFTARQKLIRQALTDGGNQIQEDGDSDAVQKNADPSGEMWDAGAGAMLSSMLKMANYSEKSQAIHRGFFARRVARSLGPHAAASTQQASWKSFMTDDNTPIELSWSWSAKRATPSVRYSVEPIGLSAGSPADPFNSRTSVELLGQTLPLAPSLDLSWYRHFMKALVVTDGESDTVTAAAADMSQTFMAFDLLDDSMVVKYYFLPAQKALSLSKSKLELVKDAISGLAASENPFAASFSVVTDYIRSKDELDQPELEIVAIDCVEPSQSRFKIYVRSKQTTFNSVLDMMTLGSRIAPISAAARCSLEELWCAVFGLERNNASLSRPLPEKDHRTSGLLYYFELKPGSRNVKSKVYLPARHYGQSDGQIARGLSGFLGRRGKGLTGEVSYYDGVRTLCKNRDLNHSLGFHSYITCSISGDFLDVTSYLNPGADL